MDIGIVTVGVGTFVDRQLLSSITSYPSNKNMFVVPSVRNVTGLAVPIKRIICSGTSWMYLLGLCISFFHSRSCVFWGLLIKQSINQLVNQSINLFANNTVTQVNWERNMAGFQNRPTKLATFQICRKTDKRRQTSCNTALLTPASSSAFEYSSNCNG